MVVGDVTTGTEVLVIGGGPGGYVAGIRAGQLDLDVTLVEMEGYGGTCLNHGCIPSKALLTATDIAHQAGTAEGIGIHADPAVDFAAMIGWKDQLVTRLTRGVESLLERAGVELISGRAEFTGPGAARVVHGGEGQGSESIEFEHAIIATGSEPIELPNFTFDGKNIISSRHAMGLDSVPDDLVIVGAGYIGMELATVFAKLGTDVRVIEQLPEALPGYGQDVTQVVTDRISELGVELNMEHSAAGWEETADGVRVMAEGPDGEVTINGDRCLVAVGRAPVTDTLALDAAGVDTDEDGAITTNEAARTNIEDIYAVGDVTGEPMLAHAAFREGEVAAERIAGEPAALDYQAMPAAVFTDPEIATVGLTETTAREEGFDPVIGEMPLRASGRALTRDAADGFVRLVADGEAGFVLGAQLVGPDVSELLGEVTLAIEMGATLEDLAATIHTHPTLSEAVHEAALGALQQSIHY
ncbi:MAG: dihydrolipoyl dehydrogenase [Salinirussus sp.]